MKPRLRAYNLPGKGQTLNTGFILRGIDLSQWADRVVSTLKKEQDITIGKTFGAEYVQPAKSFRP